MIHSIFCDAFWPGYIQWQKTETVKKSYSRHLQTLNMEGLKFPMCIKDIDNPKLERLNICHLSILIKTITNHKKA